jgi:hypothetical protein
MSVPAEQTTDALVLDYYLRYVIQTESGPLRERLQRGLVERALKVTNPAHTMTVTAITERIQKFTSLPNYPRELVVQSLAQLVGRTDVEEAAETNAGDKTYRLSSGRNTAIDEAFQKVEGDESDLKTSLTERVAAGGAKLQTADTQLVESSFLTLIGRILSAYGEHSARSLVENRDWEGAAEYPTFRRELEEAVKGLPVELQDRAAEVFEEVLRHPTKSERVYLYAMGQTYYVARLLHLDPELQSLERERFEDTTLFFDTNLLLAALLPSDDDHAAVLALLRLSSSLGLRLRYSTETSDEIDRLLQRGQQEWSEAPPINLGVAASFAPLVDNAFLKDFLWTQGKTGLSWNQYRVRGALWREVLEDLAGLKLDQSCVERDDDRAQIIERALLGPAQRRNGRTFYARQPRAAKHDAHMVAAIERLVEKDDVDDHPFGNRFWFITLDRKLTDVSRRRSLPEIGSVCMLAEEWAQYISPFLGPDISTQQRADVFSGLLSSRFFVSLGDSLSLTELQPYTAAGVDELMQGLSSPEACRVVAEMHTEGVRVREGHPEDAEKLVARLEEFVEDRLKEKRSRGELMSPEEVERERLRMRELEAERAAEREQENRELRELVRRQERYVRTSPSYWAHLARGFVTRQARRFAWYVRTHWMETILGSLAIAVGLLLEREQWLCAVSDALQYVSFVVALVFWLGPAVRGK